MRGGRTCSAAGAAVERVGSGAMCSLGGVAGTGGVTDSVGTAAEVLVSASWRPTAGELSAAGAEATLVLELVVAPAAEAARLAWERARREESDCESLRGMAGDERKREVAGEGAGLRRRARESDGLARLLSSESSRSERSARQGVSGERAARTRGERERERGGGGERAVIGMNSQCEQVE